MKVLLTGITGNLGSEVAFSLAKTGIEIIPLIRRKNKNLVARNNVNVKSYIEGDLVSERPIKMEEDIDSIVHCAGNVNFIDGNSSNEKMMKNIVKLGQIAEAPVYYVSTAFIYRPNENMSFNNGYERDKYRCEEILKSSGLEHTIFRPSVLVGNSHTGLLNNYSGYYLIVEKFVKAVNNSKRKGFKLRFPNLTGKSNMVPVDQAASCIAEEVIKNKSKLIYLTNPNPPDASWVLINTIDFFGFSKDVDVLDITFEEYSKLDLSGDERDLMIFCRHFNPYWSIDYEFPQSQLKRNLIDIEYMNLTLTSFKRAVFSDNE